MEGKRSRTIHLAVSPQADFRSVIQSLESIVLPPLAVNQEHLRFAILELLNNSIRAHRERKETRDIQVALAVTDGRLLVSVRDFGGGFDTRSLPYDVSADLSRLDLHSPEFLDYQERNGFKRFGMGIYVAKKTSDELRLEFLDEKGQPAPWEKGRTEGTLVTLSVSTGPDRAESGQAAVEETARAT
jgi:anti-sigma regulatory factor (Ser/Thr protein kinase)